MPTDTFAITANGNDGAGRRIAASWANVTIGTYSDDPFGTSITSVSKSFVGDYYVLNAFLRFDTSSIDDAATITGANLKLYVDGKDAPDGASADYAADFYDFGGSPSTSADWELTSAGDAVATITAGGLTAGVVNTIPLTGLTGISKTGFTGIRIAPKSSAVAPTGDNFIDFAALEHTTGQEPRLEVTYTLAAASMVPLNDRRRRRRTLARM